ncbi:MAG: sulfotransferase [Gammaproteobacteria bacterium]|nr:sulfotransferase [Gammaproteobacteria bacterium]
MNNREIDFFVIGYPRSGTTMAASLLARNLDIYISPETHFFRNFLPNNANSKNKETMINAFINDKRLSDIGITPSDLDKYSPEKHKITWLLNTALGVKAGEHNKSIIGEKTPAHMMYYKEIIKFYPNTKFVVIIRDGRDCIFSNIKEKWTFSNPIKHAAEWNLYMNRYNELRRNFPDKVYTVRYEDILDNPEENVRKITEYVGATFDARQIEKDESKSVIPDWEKNWKAKASEAPDKQNKYKWKLHQDKNLLIALTFIMRTNLDDHSYDTAPIRSISTLRKVFLYVRYFIYMPNVYPIMKKLASTSLYRNLKRLPNLNT